GLGDFAARDCVMWARKSCTNSCIQANVCRRCVQSLYTAVTSRCHKFKSHSRRLICFIRARLTKYHANQKSKHMAIYEPPNRSSANGVCSIQQRHHAEGSIIAAAAEKYTAA